MAARKTGLRSVTEADVPVEALKVSTVTDAAKRGTTRDLLVTMRDRVAKDVENENTPARDLAALTKRLLEIVRDIEAIDARAKQGGDEDAAEVEDGEFDASAV